MLVRLSEFARLKGVSPAAVTTAAKDRIKDAVVIRDGKKLVDVDKGMALWDRNTRRNGSEKLSPQAVAAGKRQGVAEQLPDANAVRSYILGLPEDQIPGLDVSRERKEHYAAELARLQALQGRKELLPADEVKREAFALGRAIRDGMMGIPDRLAPLLAATMDAREAHRLLSEEIRVALRSLGDE